MCLAFVRLLEVRASFLLLHTFHSADAIMIAQGCPGREVERSSIKIEFFDVMGHTFIFSNDHVSEL